MKRIAPQTQEHNTFIVENMSETQDFLNEVTADLIREAVKRLKEFSGSNVQIQYEDVEDSDWEVIYDLKSELIKAVEGMGFMIKEGIDLSNKRIPHKYYFYNGFDKPKEVDINDLQISDNYRGDLTDQMIQQHDENKNESDRIYNEEMNEYCIYRNPTPEDFGEFNVSHGLDFDQYLDDFKQEFFNQERHIFKDLQTLGYSAHIKIEDLADMLIQDWLHTVISDENYEGEYEIEAQKWANPTKEQMIQIIQNSDYLILPVTNENVEQYDLYHDASFFLVN